MREKERLNLLQVYEKAEKKSVELRTKQAELQKMKDERAKIKKKNEDADTTIQTKQIEELEDEIKGIREDINKTGVGMVKEKNKRPNEEKAEKIINELKSNSEKNKLKAEEIVKNLKNK